MRESNLVVLNLINSDGYQVPVRDPAIVSGEGMAYVDRGDHGREISHERAE